MGIAQQFDCIKIEIDEPRRTVEVTDIGSHDYKLKYDIHIRCDLFEGLNSSTVIDFFFHLKTLRVYIFVPLNEIGNSQTKSCTMMNFYMIDDCPVLKSKLFPYQDTIMESIEDEYKLKYADILLDKVINE